MLRNHPQRDVLEKELQQRFFPPLVSPCRIGHFMLTLNPHSRHEELAQLQQLAAEQGKLLSDSDTDLELQWGSIWLRWEKHTEFSTYSFVENHCERGFGPIEWLLPRPDFFQHLPGQLFRVVQLQLLPAPSHEQAPLEYFAKAHCISSMLAGNKARLWTDFRKHPEGGGRVLIWDYGLSASARARLVQQLFDVGNYRKLSLLGWPLTRQTLQELHGLEQQLLHITERIEQQQDSDDKLLRELCQLTAQSERLTAQSAARLDASSAYYQLTLDRLRSLREQPIDGLMSLQDFSERRLTPAFRTAQSLQSRQRSLLERLGRSTELLRTRINVQLERQNTNLLASMEHRARQQLALQRTVERVSAVAISYYAVQLLDKFIDSLGQFWPKLPVATLQALSVPVVILVVVWLLQRLHRKTSHG